MGVDLKLFLTREGVEELRALGDSVPKTSSDLVLATETLLRIYQSVSEDVGPHAGEFAQMLHGIKNYMEKANDSLYLVSKALHQSANKVEKYLNDKDAGR